MSNHTRPPIMTASLKSVSDFLHACVDDRDIGSARVLLLGEVGAEELEWSNEPLMKHWRYHGGYTHDKLVAFSETDEHQHLLETIERLWAGLFDVGGHALYQAFQEEKGSESLADYVELLCEVMRLEIEAFNQLRESFLEDVLGEALNMAHVNWDRVPGMHREPKSFYFPRFWAILRVAFHARGLWPAKRMAEAKVVRAILPRLEEGLTILEKPEPQKKPKAQAIHYALIRGGVVDSQAQLDNALEALKAAISDKVAQQENVVRDVVAKTPISKMPPYLDDIRKGFREALEEGRKFAQVEQNAEMSDFGPEDFRIDWAMEVERRFLVADGVDPDRGYMMQPGEHVGEEIGSAMLQGFLEKTAETAAQRGPKIECTLNDLPDKWAEEIKRSGEDMGTTEFVICPHIELETAVFSLVFDLTRQERTDGRIRQLQHWVSVRDSFKRLASPDVLGEGLDAIFFPAKKVGTLTILKEPLQHVTVNEYTRDDGEPMVRFEINEPFKIHINPDLCFGIKTTDLKRREKH